MDSNPIIWGGIGLALVMFFTWALEVHRTIREVLEELRGIRRELEEQSRRGRP